MLLESLLYGLDLLGDSRQHPLLQSVELIEASPGTNLTKTNKDTAHGLEVKGLVTVEDQHKSTQLVTKSLHRLCLSRSSRAYCISVNQVVICKEYFIMDHSLKINAN